MAEYKFVEFGYCQLSVKHVPYFIYSIVEGPRGGQYILDEFNTEVLMKGLVELDNILMVAQVKNKFINQLTKDTIVRTIYYNITTDNIKRLAAENNQRFLERKSGLAITKKIAVTFNKEQSKLLNAICTETVYNIVHGIK